MSPHRSEGYSSFQTLNAPPEKGNVKMGSSLNVRPYSCIADSNQPVLYSHMQLISWASLSGGQVAAKKGSSYSSWPGAAYFGTQMCPTISCFGSRKSAPPCRNPGCPLYPFCATLSDWTDSTRGRSTLSRRNAMKKNSPCFL